MNMLDELVDGPVRGTPDVIYEKLASMACKSAVKGNMSMTAAEAEVLISELLYLDNPYHCPHGRADCSWKDSTFHLTGKNNRRRNHLRRFHAGLPPDGYWHGQD